MSAAAAASASLLAAGAARATTCAGTGVYQLTNANSIACVNVGPNNQDGMFYWSVDGLNQLAKQWFWYRVGDSGPEHSIDTIGTPAIQTFDLDGDSQADKLQALYSGTGFTIQIAYTLLGQPLNTYGSHITENIVIKNTDANSALAMHFYQYSDFNLGYPGDHPGVPGDNDTVEFQFNNTIFQYDRANLYPFNPANQPPNINLAETFDNPAPSFCEINTVGPNGTLAELNDSDPTTLSGCSTPVSGDVTWAFEWDKLLQSAGSHQGPVATDTLSITKQKQLYVSIPSGDGYFSESAPEPATIALFGVGVLGLAAIRRRRSAAS